MQYTLGKIDTWAGDVLNRPGALARVLEALGAAGANLEFVVARQVSRNTSRVFVSPLTSAAQRKAASDVGLVRADSMHVLRIEGPDRPGLAARLARHFADAGVNIRGLSASSQNRKVVLYFGFSTPDEFKSALRAARKTVGGTGK